MIQSMALVSVLILSIVPGIIVKPVTADTTTITADSSPISKPNQMESADDVMDNKITPDKLEAPNTKDNNFDLSAPVSDLSPVSRPNHNQGASSGWFAHFQKQVQAQLKHQKLVERDNLMMQRWIIENISSIYRELKQAETDFEHYVDVTKRMISRNEQHIKHHLLATSAPMRIPFMAHLVVPHLMA